MNNIMPTAGTTKKYIHEVNTKVGINMLDLYQCLMQKLVFSIFKILR